jgi:hypothetical protein
MNMVEEWRSALRTLSLDRILMIFQGLPKHLTDWLPCRFALNRRLPSPFEAGELPFQFKRNRAVVVPLGLSGSNRRAIFATVARHEQLLVSAQNCR